MKYKQLPKDKRAELSFRIENESVMCWTHCRSCNQSCYRFHCRCIEEFKAEKKKIRKDKEKCFVCGNLLSVYHNDADGPQPYPEGWHFPTLDEYIANVKKICEKFGIDDYPIDKLREKIEKKISEKP